MPLNENRNAIELLKHDHRKVDALFAEMESESSDERKLELGRTICIELTVHTRIEEELFYPAAKEALPEKKADLIAEADVEHGSLKRLIADIDGSAIGDELFEARFTVLKEYVQHHVKEEENELMPAVERTEIDLDALGEQLAERKQALERELQAAPARSSGRARRISLPAPRARRAAAKKTRRPATKKSAHRAAATKKRAPASKRASAASRKTTRQARKSAAPAKTSTRKRAQARRARGSRS
ncbi:hemerythrin domain-containing protein [Dokdonella sp.]|uniref:hemerythrin domain-containing protein n=1 Tax=Dokdonella sp. TaxID=2291710 RepID=UPI001B037C35|nr:hemerythrin domain-containing protein [Dokdonella sp.]MBO9662874.1 hemerythrin domain-containing protein [Dokdonella sp.]